MSLIGSACDRSEDVARHFAGQTSFRDEHLFRTHLLDCPHCREEYRRHQLVAELDPVAPSRAWRLGRPLGLRGARRARPQLVAAAAVLASAAMLFIASRDDTSTMLPSLADPSPPEYAARGLEPRSRVLAYRRDGRGEVSRLARTMEPSDALAFAVENPEGFDYLLVFAVDEHDRVFWYHPAWTDPATPPRAIPIASGPEVVELQEAVKHDLRPGTLELHYLFSNQALSVVEVEKVLLPKRQPGPIFPRAREVIQRVRVEGTD